MALTRFKQIEKWNTERGLIKDYNHKNEMQFILEEVIECTTNLESKKARKWSKFFAFFILMFKWNTSKEQKADALCDIIVFATGALLKLGYNPDKAMDETLKELNARTGSIIDGKFVKDKVLNPYLADYSKAEIHAK